MKRHSLFLLLCVCFSGVCAAGDNFADFKFRLLDLGERHGRATLAAGKPDGFKLSVENINAKNYGVACADFSYNGTAQQKLCFMLRGNVNNANANLAVTLAWKSGGKWYSRTVSGISARNAKDFKTVTLSLDRDFQLSDNRYEFVQLKFSFGGGVRGATSTIEVRDIRLGDADTLSADNLTDLIVVPNGEPAASIASGVKLFFDFDNDDSRSLVQCKTNQPFTDSVQDNSFARQLVKATDGIFSLVHTPEEADVIVSSRVVRGTMGARIAEAVAGGKRLLVFGLAPDPEISTLLPLRLKMRQLAGFPEREKLSIVAPQHPLLPQIVENRTMVKYFEAAKAGDVNVLIAFPDGTPFMAEKHGVTQFASGIANQLELLSPFFYDKGLLKLLLRMAGKDVESLDAREKELLLRQTKTDKKLVSEVLLAAGIPLSEYSRWQPGMSRENVGRFGWLISESLPCMSISRSLTVTNGSGVFKIFEGSGNTVSLPVWSRKVVSGNIVLQDSESATASWTGEGTVEYTTTLPFDSAWKGKPIWFEVRDGIDDTDETFVNGQKIGATDKNAPYYWIAPRRYEIPADAIRWEGENKITVRVTNLRGSAGFNSRPQLTLAGGGNTAPRLSVTKINWTGKTYRIMESEKPPYELQFSSLSSFVRYTFSEAKELNFTQENLADLAVFSVATGRKIVSLDGKCEPLYDINRDGRLASSSLVFFRKQNGRPFLLVFQHCPESVVPRYRGKRLEGFTIRWKNSAGELFAGWPFGIRDMDTSSWANVIPADMEKKLSMAAQRALAFPEGCDEIFAINRQKNTVEILNRFRFRQGGDDWNTPRRETATLPPLAGWMLRQGRLVSTYEKLADFDVATNLGPTFGKAGSTISYSLPLPPETDFIPIGVEDKEFFPAANRFFSTGVRYSAGGKRFEAWSPATPYGNELSNQSICPFRWSFGLGTAVQELCCLDENNRKSLDNRARIRHLEPLELYQYKFFARHRLEPFSKLDYPILFNAFFPNATRYEKGFGSAVDYGDANEACLLVGWIGRQLADQCGQAETIKANWPYYRYALRYETVIDDYAYNASSCRENGVGAWVDMLNAEYSGLLAYGRMAELAGDSRIADNCLYRAAKRSIPTLARLYPGKEAETILPELAGKSYQLVGFSDDGPKMHSHPSENGNFRAANDLFDFSQGMPGKLLSLYFREAVEPIREHLNKRAWPSLTGEKTKYPSFYYIVPFSLYGVDAERALSYARSVVASRDPKKIRHDWPDMTRPFELSCLLWRLYEKLAFSCARNADIRRALFNPETRILEIECVAEADSRLVFQSKTAPSAARCNGKSVELQKGEGGYELPLLPGKQMFEIIFPKP